MQALKHMTLKKLSEVQKKPFQSKSLDRALIEFIIITDRIDFENKI